MVRGQRFKVRRVRNEMREVLIQAGDRSPGWESWRGCTGVHLYPKSNRKSLVWFNGGGRSGKGLPRFELQEGCFGCVGKTARSGNHCLPASTAPCLTVPWQEGCCLPWACWCQNCPLSCSDISCHLYSWLAPFVTI